MSDYRDRNGICFAWVQAVMAQLPFPPLSRDSEAEGRRVLAEFANSCTGQCWACKSPGGFLPIQSHHIRGSGRRCHELFNLTRLCSACHEAVAGNTEKVLWCKWANDPENTDWCKLTWLWGRCFKDGPTPPRNGSFWLPGFKENK